MQPKKQHANAGTKRKASSSGELERKKQAQIWQEVPQRIQNKIHRIVEKTLEWGDGYKKRKARSTLQAESLQRLSQLELFQQLLQEKLNLLHLDVTSLSGVLLQTKLTSFASSAYLQHQYAFQLFDYLDEGGKGVVVVEDLQRNAAEFWFGEEGNDDDDLLGEMVGLVDESGDGLLTKQDFVKIGRQVGLEKVK